MIYASWLPRVDFIRRTNDVEENLDRTIFYVLDPTVIFCEFRACMKWTQNQLEVNTLKT